MKRILTLLFVVMGVAFAMAHNRSVCIVPRPALVEMQEGEFVLSARTVISYGDKTLAPTAAFYAEELAKACGRRPKISSRRVGKSNIVLSLDAAMKEEQYTLNITPLEITVAGGSPKAVFYGLQSLRQIAVDAPKSGNGCSLPAVKIVDEPFFGYRGAMLDVCRHIFTVEEVKRWIDILALHKINRFHWHLTEDQGWRIEIKRYPELATVGAMRKETLVGKYRQSETYDGTPYGGIFTQDEVREVVRYATERYIEVIPEIEMPGHAVAALATYPHLGCSGGPYEVRTTWGISKEVFCAGKESTFEFIENVLSEVLELFPSKYIHIGGDECPKNAWKACKLCQKRIADEGLKDEHELQSYFMQRVEKWLNERGRAVIGWDEILQGGITKSATIMSWRGKKGGIAAAKLGNDVIMTPNTHCYIDYYQTESPAENGEPLANGRRPLPVSRVYALDPYEGLTEAECAHIKGVQVNLWTEYVSTFDHVQHMLLPRLAALSEVGWAYDRKDYDDFCRRLNTLRKVYDAQSYVYAPYVFNGIK